MPIEKEIKFIVETDDHWKQLSELTSIGSFALSPSRLVRMMDSYVDSEDAEIEEAGYAFRIREVGDRFIAGLKCLGRAEDGRHFRDELEQIIPKFATDPMKWPVGDVRSRLLELVGERRLRVHTRLEMLKIKRDVSMNGDSIAEWSLDEIRTPDRDSELLLRELEVELGPGASSVLLDEIARSLTALGLNRLNHSKLERVRIHGARFDEGS